MKKFLILFCILILATQVSSSCIANVFRNYQQSLQDNINKKSTYKISSINPTEKTNPFGSAYPGFRGSNQLIIYTPDYGSYTGTNEFGKEAIIIGNRVFGFTGANAYIPPNGFVVSGHGHAKKWINQNLIEGAYVTYNKHTNVIESVINLDSYIYKTNQRISDVQKAINTYKRTIPGYEYSKTTELYNVALANLNQAKYLKEQQKFQSAKTLLDKALSSADSAFYHAIPAVRNELHGIWLRPTEKSAEEIANTLDILKNTGIDNIFLETYYQGYTIYPSQIMLSYGLKNQRDEFVGWDPLSIWIEEAHKRGMKVHVWFQTFYAGNENIMANRKHIVSVYPEWANVQKRNAGSNVPKPSVSEHYGYFLDPANPQVKTFLLSLISEIATNYNVDGLNIDYIRYPKSLSVDMSNYLDSTWGYTEYARKKFKDNYGKDPLDLDENAPLLQKWIEYRQSQVTDFVSRIKPRLCGKDIILSAVVFPNFEDTAVTKLQEWPKWAQNSYIDAFTPLIMSSDEYRAGIAVQEINNLVGNKVKVYPGLFEPFTAGSPIDLLNQIIAVRKAGSCGIIIFDKAHLDDSFKDALKARIFRN